MTPSSLSPLSLKIIIGSTRPGRFSERPARWIHGALQDREGVAAELLDLRDYPMPFFNERETPSSKKKPYENEVVARWTAKIAETDAFLIVTPEYNHGYPAVLKNALDYAYQEWNRKPVAFASYGSALGARAVEQLRQVAVELKMAPVRAALHLPREVYAAGMANPDAGPEIFAPSAPALETVIEELAWWARALKAAREAGAARGA